MKKSGFCALLAALLVLSGCNGRFEEKKGEFEPSAAPGVEILPRVEETAPPAPSEEPKRALKYPAPPMEESPFAGYLPRENYYWTYDVYVAFGGVEPQDFDEARSICYPDGEYDPEAIRFTLSLPQLEGEDLLARGVNRYYQEELARRGPELRESQEEMERDFWDADYDYLPVSAPYSRESEFCYYEWNGFLTAVFAQPNGGSRSFCDYRTDVFDAESGERLTLDDLFAVDGEAYVPALEKALAEEGCYMPEESFQADAEDGSWWLRFGGREEVPLPESGDFFLTPNGIGFPYGTGEADMMAEGAVTMLLPYEAAAELLKPEILERVTE